LTDGRAHPQRLTLPAQRRLRRKPDFEAVYARGRRMGNGFFGVTARLNDEGRPRLGLAVASKMAGGSVERNRIRRVVRESFRLHQHELPAVDIVVSARARARGAGNRELRANIEELWRKVREQCGSLRGS
jgi:ribonuclease P protein component